jgi:NAD(P)-dependent dehydrogenase (short-subunit alcohol dehydrogenase family)
VLDEAETEAAINRVAEALGGIHLSVNTAGGGIAKRTLTKGGAHTHLATAATRSS